MNDFLKKLRSGNDKRYDRNRRGGYQNQQYWGQDKQGNKKPNYHRKPSEGELAVVKLSEDIQKIKSLLDSIYENQKQFTVTLEKEVKAQERQADALEFIVQYLYNAFGKTSTIPVNRISSENMGMNENETLQIIRRTQPEAREKVISIIKDMRNRGATYGQIAQHLNNETIPTFSGKGAWHAQTIHRFCK